MPTCSYFHALVTKFPTTVALYKESYCQNDYENCARHMLLSFLEEKDFQVSNELEKKIDSIAPNLSPNDQEKVIALISS